MRVLPRRKPPKREMQERSSKVCLLRVAVKTVKGKTSTQTAGEGNTKREEKNKGEFPLGGLEGGG